MRSIVWLLLVAVIAVVGATALGANDGLVTIYWRGWRTDFSLNLFLLVMAALFLAVYSLVRALDGLLALPERAKQWRTSRRDRVAQAALREGLALYLAGRYTRAHKTCQKAIAIQADTPELALDAEFTALAHMLSAGSLHRLQDRTRRDEHLQRALEMARMTRKPRATEEGARLMSAESALEDRDAARALRELSELPPGVARRTQALRLKLQAARLARQPMEALRTARLLAKHQGFTPVAAQGLLRSLAVEALDTARDADQLRRTWLQLDSADRRDPYVTARAARRAGALEALSDARGWLRPHWENLSQLGERERSDVLDAFAEVLPGLPPDWLPLLESSVELLPQDPQLAFVVGRAMAERQLWGRAHRLLESAAQSPHADGVLRMKAWRALAEIAEVEGDEELAHRCYREAAKNS